MPARRRHASRRIPSLLLALLALLALGGCGAGDRTTSPTVTDPAKTTATTPLEPTDDPGGEDGDEPAAPSRAALASGIRFDRLLAAYAPVTIRVNFLVAAETLRRDAVSSGAGDVLERQRFGAVKIEIKRMEAVLLAARPKVTAVSVTLPAEKNVQNLMLGAIDARLRALGQLRAALVAAGNDENPESEDEELEERWRASWDESLRSAREATTTMQGARAMLGLLPAPEDGIR